MAENTWEKRAALLDAKGPQLIERVQMTEAFLARLVSRQVITAVESRDLEVSKY